MVIVTEILEYVATIGIQCVCRSSDCCAFIISFIRESYGEMREVQIRVIEQSARKMCSIKHALVEVQTQGVYPTV